MPDLRFGIQLFPWHPAPQMLAYARRALSQFPFHRVWIPDHLAYENVFVILAALITQSPELQRRSHSYRENDNT